MQTSHISRYLLAVLASACLLGCGQKSRKLEMAPVSGSVTLNGTPLQDGVVSLESVQTGFAASGKLDAEGHFVIPKIPVGHYAVIVAPPELPPPGDPVPPRPTTMGAIRPIPEKFHSAQTSGLTADVTNTGVTGFDIELTVHRPMQVDRPIFMGTP